MGLPFDSGMLRLVAPFSAETNVEVLLEKGTEGGFVRDHLFRFICALCHGERFIRECHATQHSCLAT